MFRPLLPCHRARILLRHAGSAHQRSRLARQSDQAPCRRRHDGTATSAHS